MNISKVNLQYVMMSSKSKELFCSPHSTIHTDFKLQRINSNRKNYLSYTSLIFLLFSFPIHQPHESELSYYKTNKDTSGSDNDSVLSSSPPSLSPQPGTYPNNTDIWQMVISHICLLWWIEVNLNLPSNFSAQKIPNYWIISKKIARIFKRSTAY